MSEQKSGVRHGKGPFRVERFSPDEGAPQTNVLGLHPDRGTWELVDFYSQETGARNRADLEAARGCCMARVFESEAQSEVYRVDRRAQRKFNPPQRQNPLVG